jgi:Mlc titration factor MtfA (ptsG expression regulator)
MKVVKCYHSKAKAWIESQIRRIPPPIREILKEVGIYCFRTDASVDGTISRNRRTTDGRPSCHTSHFNEELNAIILFAKDVCIEEGTFNMFLHEVGHALDWRLGQKRLYISEYLDCGESLDKYASLSPREQFAQAFEAWFRSHDTPTSSALEHTREKVLEKAPRLFYLFQELTKEP